MNICWSCHCDATDIMLVLVLLKKLESYYSLPLYVLCDNSFIVLNIYLLYLNNMFGGLNIFGPCCAEFS